jgi:hypothetical protein
MVSDAPSGGDEATAGRFVPLYVLVNGRTSGQDSNSNLDLATQVIARPADRRRLESEYLNLLDRCGTWISVAEIGAYLHLPLTVTKVMVRALLEQGYLGVGAPAQQVIIDLRLLGSVLAGLERL